jgi:hypothetical protein
MPFQNVVLGKVSTILAPDQLAINVGTKNGVGVGDWVTVWRIVNIVDPDTHEDLGSVQLVKLNLKVTLAAEKYSVATVSDKVKQPVQVTSKPSLRSAPLKAITSDPSTDDDDPAQVYVKVGEGIQVRRWITEEPPF